MKCLTTLFLLAISFFFQSTPLYGTPPIEDGFVSIELDVFPVRIHYVRLPPADSSIPFKTLLFFHGLPTANAIWVPVMVHLSQMANIDSYAISFPGFGRSSAPPPEEFDYSETGLNRVPFKVADALGIERFTGVVHDAGGPWFLCPATEPENLARLEGIVVLNSLINVFKLPLEPLPEMQKFAILLANLKVPRLVIRAGFRLILEIGTAQGVNAKFPLIVEEIETVNSEETHRLGISEIFHQFTDDPLAFGGVCAETVEILDTLEPLLIWAPPNLWGSLLLFQKIWPSAETVIVSDAFHFLMLDQEKCIAAAIAAYLSDR